MPSLPIDEMAAFALVAQHKSFGKAAAELGVSRSALSHAMRGLEDRLGVRLLNRTTRSVSTTEAGDRLLTRLRPALDEITAAVEEINHFRDKPAGSLRLTVLPLAGKTILAPVVARFLAAYPSIRLEISMDAVLHDIVRDRFDAGIRPGERVERDMVVVPLTGPLPLVVFASPDYLERNGAPKTPKELQNHDCIRLRMLSGATLPWRFVRGGDEFEVSVDGRFVVNNDEMIVRAAIDGGGIGCLPRLAIEEPLREGKLVLLLEEWTRIGSGLYLYYPSRRQVPAPLRAFIDFLKAEVRGKVG